MWKSKPDTSGYYWKNNGLTKELVEVSYYNNVMEIRYIGDEQYYTCQKGSLWWGPIEAPAI